MKSLIRLYLDYIIYYDYNGRHIVSFPRLKRTRSSSSSSPIPDGNPAPESNELGIVDFAD
ncbi:MAG TPA: hypothetical protein VKA95_12465 [Nitrososphaeraceae archaeon]|nr:hypothetical protein [Nitrososphaeraceae archaeon]